MNNNILKNNDNIMFEPNTILPSKVHEVISQYMLADGFEFVLDLENSKGTKIILTFLHFSLLQH